MLYSGHEDAIEMSGKKVLNRKGNTCGSNEMIEASKTVGRALDWLPARKQMRW